MKKFLIFIISCFIFSFNSYSTHLMGGEITWKCIKSGNKSGFYVFEVKVYRDCQGVAIATTMNLQTHNIPNMSSIPLNWIEATDISPTCDTINGPNDPFSCNGQNIQYSTNDAGAVEEHIYRSDTIRLIGTPNSDGWHFTWNSCCRNNAIDNISNPGSYGFTLRAVMYPYTDSLGTIYPNNNNCYDSSPKFYEKPRTILETRNGYDPLAFSNGFTYSHNAFDEEQDSIVYNWAQPLNNTSYDYLNPNSTAIPFDNSVHPYAFDNPITGIVLNTQTGRTTYPAEFTGNYVTCTNVSSYRCGQLVSEIFREVQVVLVHPTCNLGDTTMGNVGADTLCNVRPIVQPPFFYANSPEPFRWDTMVHCGDTVSFEFEANDYDYYPNGSRQDLLFDVSGGQFLNYNTNPPSLCQNPPCATFQELSTGANPPFVTSGGSGIGYFEWITSCNHIINNCPGQSRPSLYTFVLRVQDDFCPAPAIENQSTIISIYVLPPCDLMKANPTSTAAICSNNNGTASVNPTGGFPPYNVYWFDMNGFPVNPDSLYAGDYQVRVTDSSLCEDIDTITVSQIINNIGIDSSLTIITDSICTNSFNGSIDITPLGGTPSYIYNWSNGASSQDLLNITTGIYSVIISDFNGCVSPNIDFEIFSLINQISNSSSTSFILCSGDSTGSIDITPNGGVNPYSFIWSNGEITEDINNLSAGTYWVEIIDSNLCSLLDTFLVLEAMPIQISLTSATGTISGIASGGTPPYNYSFYNPNYNLVASSANNMGTLFTINPLSSGEYVMIVSDANGCTDSATILFSTIFSPTVDVSLSNNLCDSLTDLTITVSQDSGEVDMSTGLFQSNAGSFDINNMNIGDTIGTAFMMAGGGAISLSTNIIVSSIVPPSDIIVQAVDSMQGALGTFSISNLATGGISIIANTIPDGNSYTSGNSSSITFSNVFINPCIPLIFTATINSELGDIYTSSFNFSVSSTNKLVNKGISIYPNPTSDIIFIDFEKQQNIRVRILDIFGKKVYYDNKYQNIQHHKILMESYSKGSYLISIEIDDEIYSKVIILN